MPTSALALLVLGVSVLAAVAGAVVPPAARWALGELRARDWPTPGLLRIAAEVGAEAAVPALLGLGVVLGCWVAAVARRESLALDVHDEHLGWTQDRDAGLVPRDGAAAVFLDGPELVVVDDGGRERLRRRASDLGPGTVRTVLEDHRWPWTDDDPRSGGFTRWADGHPDQSAAGHALLRGRRSALEADEPARAAEIREQLQDVGIAVRDRDGHQEVRRLTPPVATTRPGGGRGQDG